MLTRAEQRRQKQLEIEKEQRLEDDEALKMTEVCNLVVRALPWLLTVPSTGAARNAVAVIPLC